MKKNYLNMILQMNIILKIVLMEICPYMKENKNTMIKIYLYANQIANLINTIIIQKKLLAFAPKINQIQMIIPNTSINLN